METVIAPLPIGTFLLEYCIQQLLGQGGFGTTYLCRDQNLDRDFVIKEFTPQQIVVRTDGGHIRPIDSACAALYTYSLSNFLGEARTLAKFSPPNIARVVRYFEAYDTAYLVMEREIGISLRELLELYGNEAIPEVEIEAIMLPLCRGLLELHRLGILHRDIKPENLIIRFDGSPVLIDFGAAIAFRVRSGTAALSSRRRITRPLSNMINSVTKGLGLTSMR